MINYLQYIINRRKFNIFLKYKLFIIKKLSYFAEIIDACKERRIFGLGNLQTKPKSQMTDRERVQDFQRKLYRKAKQDGNFRFYVWINYYTIKGVTYPSKAKRNLRYYLYKKLTRFYKGKSQRQCKLYNQGAFEVLVRKYGLIDPTKYALS